LQFKDKIVLKFSLENLLLFSIGVILSLVIAFSLGVEKGRDIASTATKQTPVKQVAAFRSAVVEVSAAKQAPAINTEIQIDRQSYIIQAITYVKPELAMKEIKSLKNKGYQSYMAKSGKFYIVYVGLYCSEDEAQNRLKDLKQTYKDSFIKKVSRRNDS